jgi:hypothetical protein
MPKLLIFGQGIFNMQRITLKVKEDKLNFFMELIKQLDFIEIQKVVKKDTKKNAGEYDFFDSAGLWKDRDIDAQQLRDQAWKRSR